MNLKENNQRNQAAFVLVINNTITRNISFSYPDKQEITNIKNTSNIFITVINFLVGNK